jgi:mannose-1-phosphate guanylyltransferase/mannose-1-phosphate guanylyltransferase/mannose-6-phosphate isomerase
MAAEEVRRTNGDQALILVMPSDHRIGQPESFHAAVATGVSAARTGRLVTFGITPTGPETGYGYLEAGDVIDEAPGAFEVKQFTEKPDRSVAEAMIATTRHFWNGGIFLYKVGDLLREAQKVASDIHHRAVAAIAGAMRCEKMLIPDATALVDCPNLSVDYAIMERSSRIAMVPMSADWSDVGSWDALADLGSHHPERELVSAVQSRNCYVRSDGLKVGLLGVDDLVVVASGDHVLVMRKGQSQHIRELVAEVGADR